MEKLMSNRIVKMTIVEYVQYLEEMGISEYECVQDLQSQYKMSVMDMKFIFFPADEYCSYYVDGVQTVDNRYLFQGEGSDRNGVWKNPSVVSYAKLIDYLLDATE